jgi:hypothetical protein
MQREVNRSKEMMSWMSWILWPTGRSAVNAECALLYSLLAPGWFTTSCSQIPGALEVFHWAVGQDFRTGRGKLAQIWTSHIVAAGNEGSSRNTPAAWLLVAGRWLGGGRRASRRGREAARNRVRRRGGGGGWMIFRSSMCF